MSLSWRLYRSVAPVLGALAPWTRLFASPAERTLWNERLGNVVVPGGCHAWIHAASLGEAVAVGPLARELAALQPRARLFATGMTRTGRERLASLGLPASLAPIDSPQAVTRFFRGVEPRRALLVETELWPHWLLRARADRVPVAIVSARLSERSRQRYHALGAEFRGLVAGLAAVLCQSDEDRARWLSIGAPPERTRVTGNLKHDALPDAAVDRGAARLRCGLERDRPTLVLGSVRPGEARPLAAAWRALPDAARDAWQVVAVPRHARAAADLQAEAAAGGVRATTGSPHGDAWRWDARPGVLAGYYAAADVAFVGGSLRPYGGHNPMEPAALGCAVIMGRHVRSQAQSVRTLELFGAIEIASDAPRLAAAFAQLVLDRDARLAQAARGREAVRSLRGAAKRAAAQLAAWDLWPVE